MELDNNCRDRNYLYGRLLAVAERIERATYSLDEKRITNAERYMQVFAQKPFQTWEIIRQNIMPYLNSLEPKNREFFKNMFGEITKLFIASEFQSGERLNGMYLAGYDCQRTVLKSYQTKTENKKEIEMMEE